MPRPSPLQADIAAALDWWREAGVDAAFVEEPRRWLADPDSQATPSPRPTQSVDSAPPPPAAPRLGGPRSGWPRDLEAFQAWWLDEPSLDEGGLAPRVAPVGRAGAEVMLLVPMPEEGDSERLLAGPQGRLLDGFLAAAGLGAEQVYRASVLPRRTPMADWAGLQEQGLGEVLAHHVALVGPKLLIGFGQNILPLCGHDPAQATQKLRSFNHEGGRVPALFEAGLDRLLGNWKLRARLWQRWLEWAESDTWRAAGG